MNGIDLDGASPDFTKEQFLAHAQARINDALNEYAVSSSDDTVQYATALGVNDKLFARTVGTQMSDVLEATEVVKFKHYTSSLDNPSKFVITDNTNIEATDIVETADGSYYRKSFNWTVSNETFDSGDTFSINIGGDNSYTYTASSGDGRNEVISGLVSLIGTELDGEYTITTTEDGNNKLSNFIVTADDVTNDFSFTATFSDYLQNSSNNTYFTGTAMNGSSAAADEFSATSHIFNLETDTVANYAIGDQLTFSAVN